jgi:hypothetical protein
MLSAMHVAAVPGLADEPHVLLREWAVAAAVDSRMTANRRSILHLLASTGDTATIRYLLVECAMFKPYAKLVDGSLTPPHPPSVLGAAATVTKWLLCLACSALAVLFGSAFWHGTRVNYCNRT